MKSLEIERHPHFSIQHQFTEKGGFIGKAAIEI
jgi:hypothetical protein